MTTNMIDEDRQMKSFRRKDNQRHNYIVKYLTNDTVGHINQVNVKDTLADLDEILNDYLIGSSENDFPTKIISIQIDGNDIAKPIVDQWNNKLFGSCFLKWQVKGS